MYLIFDTETTDLPRRAPPSDPAQPWVMQLAALAMDADFRTLAEVNFLIRVPDHTIVSRYAAEVNGISREHSLANGIDVTAALAAVKAIGAKSKMLVGHNVDFDVGIVTSVALRAGCMDLVDWLRLPRMCTMKAMTPVCAIPSARGHKWPKLTEAYARAFGKEFDGAHDALADVRACAKVLEWYIKRSRPAASRPLELNVQTEPVAIAPLTAPVAA